METFIIKIRWWGKWSKEINRCFLPSQRKHLCPCYPLLYVVFMLGKCCKCSHICYSLYKMQMHHLLGESPPMAELSPLIIDSCSWGKLTNWTLCFCNSTLWISPSVGGESGQIQSSQSSLWEAECVHLGEVLVWLMTLMSVKKHENTGVSASSMYKGNSSNFSFPLLISDN